MDLLSSDDRKSYTYTDMLFQLLLSTNSRKSFNPLSQVKEFFSWVDSISSSKIRKKIFYRFLDKKVATAPTILLDLNVSEPGLYRELKILVKNDVLEYITDSRIFRRKTGRPPRVYGLKGKWTPDDIVRAIEEHNAVKKPTFVLVATIGQSIMDDYIQVRGLEEIHWSEINALCKGNCKGFYTPDITKKVAQYLTKQGVQVIYAPGVI